MQKLTLVVLLVLAGCNKLPGNTSTKSATTDPVKLELASPDQAVKTWWHIRDVALAESHQRCEEYARSLVEENGFKGGEAISTGVARANLGRKPDCSKISYSREIAEVKVESDTRAVVLAKIKATTPIPPGGEPDADDVKRREQGFPYKYVLEKVGKDWKIAQIYTFASYKETDPWSPVFSDTNKPFVHAYVGGAE